MDQRTAESEPVPRRTADRPVLSEPWHDDADAEGGFTLRAIAIPGATFVLTTLCLAGLYWTRGATPLERLAPRENDGWQAVALFLVVALLAVVVAGFLTHAIASLALSAYVHRSRRLRRELVLACAAGIAPRLPTPRNAAQSLLFQASIDAYLHQHGAPALSRFVERGLSLCRTSLACALSVLFATLACASVVQRALDLGVPVWVSWNVAASVVFGVALVLVITAALAFVEHFAALLAWLRERARREIAISAHPEAYVSASLPDDFRSARPGAMAYVWALVAGALVGLWAWGLWSQSSPVTWLVWMGALSALAVCVATFTLAWRRWSDETRVLRVVESAPVAAPAPAPAPEVVDEPARKPARGDMEIPPEPEKPPISPALAAMMASQPHLERPKKLDAFDALAKRTRGSDQWLEMTLEAEKEAQASAAHAEPAPAPINGKHERAKSPSADEGSTAPSSAPRVEPSSTSNAKPSSPSSAPASAPASASAHDDAAHERRREDVRAAVLRRLAQETPRRQAPPPPTPPAESSSARDDDDRPRAQNVTPAEPRPLDAHDDPFASGAGGANGVSGAPQRTWLVSPHGLRATSAIAPGRLVQDEVALQSGSDDPFAWAAFGLHAPRVDTGVASDGVRDADEARDAGDARNSGASGHAGRPPTPAPARASEPAPELPQDDPRGGSLERPSSVDDSARPGPRGDTQRDPGTMLF